MDNHKHALEKKLIGKAASVRATVTEADTAKTVGSGSLNVFATPMMIALMEKAACECLADVLGEGQTSVGTQIAVDHTAASPLGAEVTATAVIEDVSGRKIEFAVTASDGMNQIGKGRHTRAIVGEERFLAKVKIPPMLSSHMTLRPSSAKAGVVAKKNFANST